MPATVPHAFTQREFRDALGKFATGVAIVTAKSTDGTDIGMTVNSLNSVSLDPPLILFSVARSAGSFDHWQRASQFGVSILSESQGEIALRFARPAVEKWRDVRAHPARDVRAQLISDAIAHLECKCHAHHDAGDHLIIVGRVVNLQSHSCAASAGLLFYEGRFRQLRPADHVQRG